MIQKLIFYLGLLTFPFSLGAQTDSLFLENLMRSSGRRFSYILQNPERYEVQILYTQVNRDSLNHPHLTRHSYRLNPNVFFNPASLVKLPTAALALEKLGEIPIPGVNKFARMGTDSSFICQIPRRGDDLEEKYYPCIARYIERMLLVSSNDSYTRIFEFLGGDYIDRKLKEKGYPQSRIVRRFADCDSLQNRYTNQIHFYNQEGQEIYQQLARYNQRPYIPPLGKVKKYKGYLNEKWKIVLDSVDYTYSNFLPLSDIHQMLISLMMPEVVPDSLRFDLYPSDYKFLWRGLSSYPREGEWTAYKGKRLYYDTFKKYLYYGRKNMTPAQEIRIFNIVGWWAGYLSDVAYFVDFDNKVEFFLSAVVYTNRNHLHDFKFEYNTEGFPFLANLGQVIYQYELKRPKKYLPKLDKYQLHRETNK